MDMQAVREGLERLSRFDKHPIGQQIIREDQEVRLAARKALVEKRAAAKRAHEKQLPVLLKTRDAAGHVRAQAQTAFKKADEDYYEAEQAIFRAQLTADLGVARAEKDLTATAPAAIATFVHELEDVADHVRMMEPAELEAKVGLLGRHIVAGSNYHAQCAFLERAREIRRAAAALALEALTDAELVARFGELRERLGTVPGVQDITASRPEYAGIVAARAAGKPA